MFNLTVKKYGRYQRFNGFTETRNSGFIRCRKITDSRHTAHPTKENGSAFLNHTGLNFKSLPAA